MTSIVDASVAVRWYLPEEFSDEAERILFSEAALLAPDLVLAEIGNAVWKRTRRKEVSIEEAVRIIDRASAAFTSFVTIRELAPRSMQLSAELDQSIYDCFYLALAQMEDSPLVTTDRKQAVLAERIGLTVDLIG